MFINKPIFRVFPILVMLFFLASCVQTIVEIPTRHANPDYLQATKSHQEKLQEIQEFSVKFNYISQDENILVSTHQLDSLIKVSSNQNNDYLYYIDSKLVVAEDSSGYYEFNSKGKLIYALDVYGQLAALIQDELASKARELNTYANEIFKKYSINSKHSTVVEKIYTGEDAQLNYLCIEKIKQVAQTNRIFRSSKNRSKDPQELKATVRLNGDQFYALECQIDNNMVIKLALISK